MARNIPVKRREFVGWLAALGSGATPLAVSAAGLAQDRPVFTREIMIQAEEMAGIKLTDPQRELALPVLQSYLQNIRRVREMSVPPEVPPALYFLAEPAALHVSRREPAAPAVRRRPLRKPQGGSR